MFKKLREKLSVWTKKISEKKPEEPTKEETKPVEEPVEETKEPETPLEKIKEAAKEIAEEVEEIIETPMKFDVAHQQVQPDLDKIREIVQGKGGEKEKTREPVEPEPEKPKPGTKSFFKRVTSKISKIKISEKEFDVYSEELEMLLLENNVALEVAEKIIKELKDNIIDKEFLKKELESEINDTLKEIIRKILLDPFLVVDKIKEKTDKPYVILFCGINGTGKTTTIAKIADQLKRNNITSVFAAGDTFRAASIEQIKKHGENLNIKVIAQDYGSDPAAVGFDAIQYAKKNNIDCVLIDTAGRMHTAKNLLEEIKKISKVTNPDLKIFVGESITGNDAVEQVKSFDWAIGIDGIILSKADIDEKGGTALSVGYVTKKPILYLGTGQEYDKIEPFDKEGFIKKLGLD